jgi:hypothetical protein
MWISLKCGILINYAQAKTRLSLGELLWQPPESLKKGKRPQNSGL